MKRTGAARKKVTKAIVRGARTRPSGEAADLAEKVWALMAAISICLSEHRLTKQTREYRRLVDQARKALFDLHSAVTEHSGRSLPKPSAKATRAGVADLVGRMMLLRRDTDGPLELPDVLEARDAVRRFPKVLRRALQGVPCLVHDAAGGTAAIVCVDNLLPVLVRQSQLELKRSNPIVFRRFQSVLKKAAEVFGGREPAERWLTHPAMGLDHQVPAKLLATKSGTRLVEQFLQRLDYGVYT